MIIGMAGIMLLLSACSRSATDAERQTIATAYAEVMITKNTYRHDSVRMVKAVDSVVRAFGFSDQHDLMASIIDLSEEPESLRKMLDSAQKRLERAQSGTEFKKAKPATPPQKSSGKPDSTSSPLPP